MWLDLQIFGFRALWTPYLIISVIIIGIIYFLFTGPLRHKFGDVEKVTRNQQLFFYSGLLLFYFVKGSPVDLLSHIMMSAHMAQMAILYMVIPIFLIRGLPVWMWERLLNLPVIKPIFNFLRTPLLALMIFNASFAIYHVPAIFDFSKTSQFIHISVVLYLFATAFIMWWPIVTPIKAHNKLVPLLKMGYLVVSIIIITIPCALMIFSESPVFATYSSTGSWIQALSLCVPADVLQGLAPSLTGADMFSPLSGLEDQQLGGIIMMFLQQIIYGFVFAWVFFGWFTKKSLETDPMPTTLPDTK